MRNVGRERHVLLPPCRHDAGIAQLDVLGTKRKGAQAGAANLVDSPGGAFDRQTGIDMSLTGRVLALAVRQNLPENRL